MCLQKDLGSQKKKKIALPHSKKNLPAFKFPISITHLIVKWSFRTLVQAKKVLRHLNVFPGEKKIRPFLEKNPPLVFYDIKSRDTPKN